MKAFNRWNSEVPCYDDGFPGDPLWIHRDSMGISGIVRARSLEDAYSVCEDEFFPSAEKEDYESEDFKTIYVSGRKIPYTGELAEHPCWQEQFGFRPNGPNSKDDSGIYYKDLNGDYLDILTPALTRELELRVSFPEECLMFGDWKVHDYS